MIKRRELVEDGLKGMAGLFFLGLTGCGSGNGGTAQSPKEYEGSYFGDFKDPDTDSSGSFNAVVTVDEVAKTFTIALSLIGTFRGQSSPSAQFSGTFDNSKTTVQGSSTVFGDATLEIQNNGNLTGQVTNIDVTITSVDVTGSVDHTGIEFHYTVRFADNTTLAGTVEYGVTHP